jgi:hypothetical protein
LIAIQQEHLVGQLFEKVFVPVAVHEELTDARTPETVRRRVLALPAWLEVRKVQETQTTMFPVTLHRGEREAILLAEALRAGCAFDRRTSWTHYSSGPESPALGNAFIFSSIDCRQRLRRRGFRAPTHTLLREYLHFSLPS